MTLRTLNYGNYGIFLIMGNAGFCPSTVGTEKSSFAHSLQTVVKPQRALFKLLKNAVKVSEN